LEVVFVELLLLVWKKPSANLPLLETSVSSPASEPPRECICRRRACRSVQGEKEATKNGEEMHEERSGLEDGK
jgi:hypothetical protein